MSVLSVKRTRSAALLYLLLLLLPVSYWCTESGFRLDHSASYLTSLFGHPCLTRHPIEVLSNYWTHELDNMLNRQSKTVEEAITEYKRRYKRMPPPGFEDWFHYAQKHNSVIIDDYDSIDSSISSIRSLTPSQILEAVSSAVSSADARLVSYSTADGAFEGAIFFKWMGEKLTNLFADLDQPLPKLSLALNALDEPRVLPDHDQHPPVRWIDQSHQSTWNRTTRDCSISRSTSKYAHISQAISTQTKLPFIVHAEEAKDLCLHPEYANMHGVFQSPATFIYTDSILPILSPAKLSTFGDILYPPPYYIRAYDQGRYKEEEDPIWEEKWPQLYWVGSTTGSHATNGGWRSSHRQRFVARVNQLSNESINFLTEASPGVWKTFESQDIFSQLYNVKFTRINQCEPEQCDEETAFFQPSSLEGMQEDLKYRFVFDLDGNSFSGRFYSLLASRSLVLKQTIFQEWHDERLIPWVHYIPVSLDMGELPEVMRYFTLTKRGSIMAKSIADNGRVWLRKALRKEDASVYMYRLLLELGRLLE